MLDKIRAFFKRDSQISGFARQPLYSEQAYYHMLQYFGTIPDPDLLLQQAGIARWQLRRLELDDEIAGRLEDRASGLIATPWTIEPSTTRAAKFVKEQLTGVMERLDRATISAVAYGYSMSEVVYSQLDGGRTGIKMVSRCPIQWFDLLAEDNTWLYHPDDGSGGFPGVECDPRKFIPIVRNPTMENPYGESLLSRLWFPVLWRDEGWRMWLNFLSTFGEPIVAANVQNYENFVKAMQAQGVRSVVAWQGQKDDKIDTIQPSTSGEFERMELALTKRIQKLILGNTMTTDGGIYGSRACGEVGLQVEDTRRLADIRMNTEAVQRIVDVLCELNNFQPLRFIRRDETGLESARSDRDKNLAPVLQTSGLKLSRSYFVDNYGLEDEDLEDAPQSTAPTVTPTFSARHSFAAQGAQYTETQQAVEDLGSAALNESPDSAIQVDDIRSIVMSARDKADLERRLLVLFESSDSLDPAFQSTLERAHFAAQVLGYVAAEELRS